MPATSQMPGELLDPDPAILGVSHGLGGVRVWVSGLGFRVKKIGFVMLELEVRQLQAGVTRTHDLLCSS